METRVRSSRRQLCRQAAKSALRRRPALLPLLALLASVAPTSRAPGEEPLLGDAMAAAFREPPARHRTLQIIHGFPDAPAALAGRVQWLTARGFGGVVANVSFDDYLRSDSKWDAFRAGVDAVKQAGLVVWLYDEQGYPSASAGGLTLEGHPEWEARGLLCVVADHAGAEPLELELPAGDVVLAAAYPLRAGSGDLERPVDLSDAARGSRTLRWERPGEWRVCAFVETRLREGTHAMENLHRKRPYPNLLEHGPTARFIELTHAAYARRFSPLAERFPAIFTDEPSLMSVFLRASPHPVIPWSPGLAEAFSRRKGYELVPVLPALVSDFGARSHRVRCDFWDVIGREVAESYFGQIQDWCREHGIASTGHLLAEEDLGSHVGFYGNFYACASRLDIPGIDCLTSLPATVPWHVAKLLGSIRCLHGRDEAMSETSDHSQRYRPPGDSRPVQRVSAEEILGTAHRLYVAGITTTTSYYSWDGLDDAAVRRINERIGRLGAVLSGAQHTADVALLYPVESAWAHFVPQRVWANAPGVARIDGIYRGAMTTLSRHGLDFDVIDASAIARARVETGGVLAVGHERYRVLVLPATDVLPLAALERIRDFLAAGGAVVAAGDLPLSTPETLRGTESRRLVEALFGAEALEPDSDTRRMTTRRHAEGGLAAFLPEGSAWLLPDVVGALVEPDVRFDGGTPLLVSHWRRGSAHVYFVVNDSPAPVDAALALRASGPAERWDLESGETARIEPEADGRWRVTLDAHGATFLVFASAREPRSGARRAGVETTVEAVSLVGPPSEAPQVLLHAPAHVEKRLAALDGANDGPMRPPVRAAARLLEGGVDTWCFLELRYASRLDLAGFRALELVMETPAEQTGCGARSFLVLAEENEGGVMAEYIAELGRGMGLPGRARTTVALESFELAGWSRDPDGAFDPARVRSIRIGWGGYHGAEGERISFDVVALRGLR